MNQILAVEKPQEKRKKHKSGINSILTVFAVILMIFGLGLTSSGGYAFYKNLSNNVDNKVVSSSTSKPVITIERESAEVTVILRWINGSSNLGLKTNTAEISEDHNDWGIPDRDSTPDNQKPGEDDIDDASVLLSIKTGIQENAVKIITIGAVILVVLSTGIILLKKFVL